MTTVATLFSSQAEATAALDAMASTEFEDVETRVYQGDVADDVGEVQPAGLPSPGSDLAGASPQAVLDSRLADLDDEELSDFFVEAVEEGGAVLIVADVDDERADALAAFFRDQGGRTAQGE